MLGSGMRDKNIVLMIINKWSAMYVTSIYEKPYSIIYRRYIYINILSKSLGA